MSDSVRSALVNEENKDQAGVANSDRAQNSSFLHNSTEIVHALFGPSVGPCFGDFSCHYHRHHGRLYASSNAVSFYSQLFGFERKLCLYLQDIVEMEAYRSTSVRIATIDSEEHIFRSFYNRNLVVQLLDQLRGLGTATPLSVIAPPAGTAEEQEDTMEEKEVIDEPTPSSPPISERPSSPVQSQSFVSSLRESGIKLSMRSKSLSCLDQERPEDAVTFPPTESETSSVGTPENLLEAWQEIIKSAADFKEMALEGLTLSCDLKDFFDLFLADNAPFSMASYQENVIGDYELETMPWTEDGDTQARTISFRHPITKTFGMGPSSIHTTSYQRLRSFGPHGTCIETSSVIEGIPSADCFTVEDQWLLQPSDTGGMTLSVRYDVRFTKRTFLKKMIQNSTRQETAEWYKGYADMLQSSLQAEGRLRKDQREVSLEGKGMVSTNQNVRWGWLQKTLVCVLVVAIFALLIAVFVLLIHVTRLEKNVISLQAEIWQLRSDNTELANQVRDALTSTLGQSQCTNESS